MNKFELYCMIFYALDAQWEESENQELGEFLSRANPFLFADEGSADPAVYADFCRRIPEAIPIEKSYEIARGYVQTLGSAAIVDAFSGVDEQEWLECTRDYLKEKHKSERG